ncbi:MAG: hypothetical protein WCA21_14405 [Terracidiphilus sp.]
MSNEPDSIHRYTDLPGLLYLLQRKKLTLLDPASWDDTNDSHFLAVYKQAKKLKCLAALCFSEADETYHHWRVFSSGTGGVRITFRKTNLLKTIHPIKEIRANKIDYRLLDELQYRSLKIQELPFVKRYPYKDEDEYRLIYESTIKQQSSVDIDIPLKLIRRISLSPWMNKLVANTVKEVIKSIPGCGRINVSRSTLIGNEEWMAFGNAAMITNSTAGPFVSYGNIDGDWPRSFE